MINDIYFVVESTDVFEINEGEGLLDPPKVPQSNFSLEEYFISHFFTLSSVIIVSRASEK